MPYPAGQQSLVPSIVGVQVTDYDGEYPDGLPQSKRTWVEVWPFWSGVDRPRGVGYVCSDRLTAERLRCAINAGVVFVDPQVGRDVNGKTYVQARSTVMGKRMNADLRRLGF